MVGRMDGAVLPTIWSLILQSLPRLHQAFEFFGPVQDDVDFLGPEVHGPVSYRVLVIRNRRPGFCNHCGSSSKPDSQ